MKKVSIKYIANKPKQKLVFLESQKQSPKNEIT